MQNSLLTEKNVIQKIMSSKPEDFQYDDDGSFFLRDDINLRIVDPNHQSEHPRRRFEESWVAKFEDSDARVQLAEIYYNSTKLLTIDCAVVDGGRHVIPYPEIPGMTISEFQYHIGLILNFTKNTSDIGFDRVLEMAGITVLNSTVLIN